MTEVRARISIRVVYPDEYNAIADGRQPFVVASVRDLPPRVGDVMTVREIDTETAERTGRELIADVTSVKEAPTVLVAGLKLRATHVSPRVLGVLQLVVDELSRATSSNGPFNSAHEGFAVLLEEVDELKEIVWQKPDNRNLAKMRAEAVQIAAMGVRMVLDCCEPQDGAS